jgi:hypothetical protein
MSAAARISSPLRYLAMTALATVVAGCASAPPPTAPGSPASTAELRDLSDFTKKAQNEGWTPEVRGDQVLYCMDESPMNSRLPERTCLDKTSLQQQMLAQERQRESIQRPGAAGGCATTPCP